MKAPPLLRRMRSKTLALALSALCLAAGAQPALAQQVTIVVSGLGGNADYQQNFDRYAAAIAEQSRKLSANPTDTILLPGSAATRENILGTIEDVMARAPASFALYLIGHGSHDGEHFKYNIPGPDITGEQLHEALANQTQQRQFVVVATSASGAVLDVMQADNRVLITATKSGGESNAVLFPQFLSAAISDIGADTDKNEIISAEELFQYTERAVAAHYETEKLLASEHPRLQGSFAADFATAHYGTLLNQGGEIAPELLEKRNLISEQINRLRARKDDLSEDSYFDELQSLMLELGTVQREIDQRSSQ